jgi:hypothetical protein
MAAVKVFHVFPTGARDAAKKVALAPSTEPARFIATVSALFGHREPLAILVDEIACPLEPAIVFPLVEVGSFCEVTFRGSGPDAAESTLSAAVASLRQSPAAPVERLLKPEPEAEPPAPPVPAKPKRRRADRGDAQAPRAAAAAAIAAPPAAVPIVLHEGVDAVTLPTSSARVSRFARDPLTAAWLVEDVLEMLMFSSQNVPVDETRPEVRGLPAKRVVPVFRDYYRLDIKERLRALLDERGVSKLHELLADFDAHIEVIEAESGLFVTLSAAVREQLRRAKRQRAPDVDEGWQPGAPTRQAPEESPGKPGPGQRERESES